MFLIMISIVFVLNGYGHDWGLSIFSVPVLSGDILDCESHDISSLFPNIYSLEHVSDFSLYLVYCSELGRPTEY